MQRRGLTFIEVLVSVAMLSIIAGAILSSVTFMKARAARDALRLEAMEVAHRVVLQHVDDEKSLLALRQRYPYGERTYLFRVNHVVLQEGSSDDSGLSSMQASNASDLGIEESIRAGLEQVTVYVYLEDPRRPGAVTSEPLAELTRIYSPLYLFDSNRLIDWVLELLNRSGTGTDQ